MQNITIVTAVRNKSLFLHCIFDNDCCRDCRLLPFDNTEKNESIPVLYNRAIEQIEQQEPQWIVFCHEDFEVKTRWHDVVSQLNFKNVYGPAGARYVNVHGFVTCRETCGIMTHSNKDGTQPRPSCGNRITKPEVVDTLDCACIIIHSSTTKKFNLRFDERLSFDLYGEDFCIQAREFHRLRCMALPLKAHHWSAGVLSARYFRQLLYLHEKWPHSTYAASCSVYIGGAFTYKRFVSVLTTIGTRRLLLNLFKRFFFALHLVYDEPLDLKEELLRHGVLARKLIAGEDAIRPVT